MSEKLVSNVNPLNINECADFVFHVAQNRTVFVRGYMGWGKTSIRHILKTRSNNYSVYLDATRLDLGDLWIPAIRDVNSDAACVKFVPNEELGIHFGKPIDLLIDEFGKANRSVQNALLRLMLEREYLPEGSRVWVTSNLASENVGDVMLPHVLNRIVQIDMRKSTAEEWMQWAIQANCDPVLIAACNELPEFFAAFTDYKDPKQNEFIHDPRDPSRKAFVTGRSLEAASDILKLRNVLGEKSTFAGVCGAIGAPAAHKLMAYITLGDSLTSYEQIVANPATAPVPSGTAARIMLVVKCVQKVEPQDFASVFAYIQRFPKEMAAMFANQIMSMPSKQSWLVTNASFTKYATQNFGLFQKTK
jgi:hypothetical protein